MEIFLSNSGFVFFSLVISYLIGSFSSAIIIAKIMKLDDPRLKGSKNAGATNMHRLYGKTPAILTLVLDCLKGVIAILIAKKIGLDLSGQIIAGLMVILGHIYPIFFGFKGGKGVATYLGVLLGFYYPSFIVFAISWLMIAKVFRISSVAALIACVAHLCVFWFYFEFTASINFIITVITILIFYTHRTNLKQIIFEK